MIGQIPHCPSHPLLHPILIAPRISNQWQRPRDPGKLKAAIPREALHLTSLHAIIITYAQHPIRPASHKPSVFNGRQGIATHRSMGDIPFWRRKGAV